jgi:hypothetical protein
MLYQFGLFLTALLILIILLAIITLVYDLLAKLLEMKPEISIVKPQNKTSGTITQPVVKKVLYLRFEVENKALMEVKELTNENFKELLSPYFIAVDYLLELWIFHPFNLIITDRIPLHFGKDIKLEGFIRHNDVPEIFIKAKATKKFKTGILIHEISHQLAYLDAQQRNIRTTSHGPLFKKHMRLLFKPLLLDNTYYKKHNELSYHLSYEPRKYSPAKDLCM